MLEFIADNIILFVALILLLFLIINLESKQLFGKVKPISNDGLTKLLNNNKIILLDLRDNNEYANGHIVSAQNITMSNIDSYKIKEGSIVVTYASSDSEAQKAASLLVKRGVTEVFYLEGGINSWLENNMPLSGER